MIPRPRLWAATGLAMLFAFSPALGQELATGTWSGTVTPPDDAPLSVEYEVSYDEEGALQITLIPPPDVAAPPRIPFRDIELQEEILLFSWAAGPEVTCELLLQEDGSFEGECWDDDGTPGQLTMVPPKEDPAR